jgi:hypothetical protein
MILASLINLETKIILRISGYPKLNILRRFFWKIFSKKIYKVTTPTKETYDLLITSNIFDNAKNFPMIEVLVKKVKKNYLQKALKKYVNSQNSHHYYSMLILYKVIKLMGSDKLIEPVTYEEIQNEVDRLHEIEKSFMTTKDLEKIKDILDGVVPKEDTVKKIELFKELKQVKKQINDWIIKLKTSDTDGGDDDDDDGKHKDGDDSIEKIILKLKEKESELIKQFKKFDKDFYLSIEKSIKDLELKLQEKPLSKEDEILFKNNFKSSFSFSAINELLEYSFIVSEKL